MKPHFIIKFKPGVELIDAPYWADFIEDRSGAVETIGMEIDKILRKYKFECFVTHEFKPKHNNTWSIEETQAGLDRIYRIIAQQDCELPNAMIEEIKTSPLVEK